MKSGHSDFNEIPSEERSQLAITPCIPHVGKPHRPKVGSGSFADMQQSPRERPLPGAKQTYLGQPRVGRRVYGKELFSVYLRFEGESDRFSEARDSGLRGYTEKI